ncbi:MAG: hypothetical protein PUF11_09425 [Parafannyhessea umbonata]|uniref:hypothetical protein n=1 Tax=Parafannyhessea umbonata TaxID=604330 RepID=UPI0026F28270|nr:hypothetical protein [Parafannyhessea umbonata]MDD6566985.1 hypothetical protein [Parafannyhessea umbonata]
MSKDVEPGVYTFVTKWAKQRHPKLTCSSWADNVPSEFPYALVCMTDEHDLSRTLNSSHANEYRHVTFEVNCYSAATSGRKYEAKAISRTFADAFKALGFVQTAGGQPIDLTDGSNRTIARYFCRFEANVSDGGTIHKA